MADSPRDQANAFNARTIEEFRGNGGKVGGVLEGMNLILLHTVGARSGRERVTPLGCGVRPDGRYLIVASNAGSPVDPDWAHNLRAHPEVTVEVGTETFKVTAEEVVGAEYEELWPQMIAGSSGLRDFAAKAGRRIPLFLLARQG